MIPVLFVGAAVGGAAMYLFDPEHGRRRRALLRDQATRAQSDVRDALDAGRRDLANRASALSGRARSVFRRRKATDYVLVERVRSKMGRYVAHPGAIEVSAAEGEVTLSGSVLAHEHSDLVDVVAQVPGVKNVVDRLNVFEKAEGISELQGERERRSRRMQENWAPGTRLVAGAAGTTLTLYALRGGFRGLVLGTAGALLLLRSTTNKPLSTLAGVGEQGVIDLQKMIQINAPLEQVFQYLANYENFPQFMRNVRSVETRADGRSHWVVSGPAGTKVEWDSYVVDRIPNQLISWSSVEGSPVRHTGSIGVEASEGGTRVQIQMSYTPPAGLLGHAIARMFGADPKTELDEDMMRLKSTLETGKQPRDAAAAKRQGEHAEQALGNTQQPA